MDSLAVLATLTAKAAVILFLALIAVRSLRRGSAATRHLIWNVAFVGLLVSAASDLYTPRIELSPAATPDDALTTTSSQVRIPEQPAPEPPVDGWRSWLFAAWVAGTLLTASRLLFSLLLAGNLAARPALVTDWYERLQRLRQSLRINRNVELLVTRDASVPMTWGALQPVVILPASAVRWTEQQLDMVLAHELAHIRRWDWATQLIAYASAAVYWFFPPVWLALRESRKERERACDDVVLRLGTRPTDYAEHLVQLAKSMAQPPWSAALAMAQESHLENRVIAMLDAGADRSALRRRTIATTGVAAVISLALLLPFTWTRPKLEGVVFDASGAVVPDASIALVSQRARYTTRSGPDGAFAIQSIPRDVYEFQAMRPGFRRFRQVALTLAGGRTYHMRPVLTVGGVHETLNVTAIVTN